MHVQALDHVNIRVADPAATMAFFKDVLGMGKVAVPGMAADQQPPGWITDEAGHPAIHIGSLDSRYPSDDWRPPSTTSESGPVHHVALACTGHDDLIARLEDRGLRYDTNFVESIGLRQIFVAEPGGVLLELNFKGD